MGRFHEKILVLDFGSQYTQLIARRVREAHVYSEILPYNASVARILGERDDLFKGIEPAHRGPTVWMSHGDRIEEMPAGFVPIARTNNSPIAAMKSMDPGRPVYCLQFHPEVAHTEGGSSILQNFVRNICRCKADWSMRSFMVESIEAIRAQVGAGKLLCALSGGVDSAVAALLAHEAVGDRLTCLFVDNGLLRKGEKA